MNGVTCLFFVHPYQVPELADRLLDRLEEELKQLPVVQRIVVSLVPLGSQLVSSFTVRGWTVLKSQEDGYGAAVRQALAKSEGDYLLTLDCESTGGEPVAPQLWALRGEADIVIASRYLPSSSVSMPRFRRFLSLTCNRFLGWVLDVPYRDLSSGLRLYRRRALEKLATEVANYAFLPESVVRAHAAGMRLREIPIHFQAPFESLRSQCQRLIHLGIPYLIMLGRLWRLRNSLDSVDYDERAYYSRNLIQRHYHRRRYAIVTSFADGGGRVADLGCGTSKILEAFPEGVGVDVNLAKLRYKRPVHPRLVVGALERVPLAGGRFDVVICAEVIEHLPKSTGLFREMSRLLKPGGRLILGTPDFGRLAWRVTEWIYDRVMPGAYGHEHISHYTRAELVSLLHQVGLKTEDFRYIGGGDLYLKAVKG